MTLQDIRDRLDSRGFGSNEGQDFVRSALLTLVNGAINEGHEPDLESTCFICQALGEIVAIDNLTSRPRS